RFGAGTAFLTSAAGGLALVLTWPVFALRRAPLECRAGLQSQEEATMKAVSMLVLVLAVAARAAAQPRPVIQPPATAVGLPFSPAVRAGNMLYLSGQIGNRPGTRDLADTGIAGQTRQALENVKALLTSAGSSLERVV